MVFCFLVITRNPRMDQAIHGSVLSAHVASLSRESPHWESTGRFVLKHQSRHRHDNLGFRYN